MSSYYLMHQNKPVLQFDPEEMLSQVLDESLIPYSLRGKLLSPKEDMSASQQAHLIQKNHSHIIGFLARRVLTMSRMYAKEILNSFAYTQSQTDEDRAWIAIDSSAVSCGDSYWIKSTKSDLIWSDVNPRLLDTSDALIQISLLGKSLTPGHIIRSPELTTLGSYAKAWIREDGKMYLYKRSGIRREADRGSPPV